MLLLLLMMMMMTNSYIDQIQNRRFLFFGENTFFPCSTPFPFTKKKFPQNLYEENQILKKNCMERKREGKIV